VKGPRIFASRLAPLSSIAVVLAALIGGALADAQAPAPDDAPHLLVVPDTAQGEAALARTDARIVARYESFSLVEAAGGDDERLRQAGADRRDDMRTVRTAAGDLDPKRARRSLAGKQAPERDEVLALVQFVGPPKDAWVERLRATGATIVTYQAENAYVVHADGDVVERLAALVGGFAPVRAVSVLTAADKLESRRSPTGRYAVQTVAGGDGADARDEAAALGAGVGRPVTLGTLHTQYLALSDAEAAQLARDPAVVAIEPYAEPELADERGAQIVAGNLNAGFAPSGPGYLGWLVNPDRIPDGSTFDFAIDVTDEGLDNGASSPFHPDFRALGSGASRVAYRRNYTGDTPARDCGGHGTNVASIAAGYSAGSGVPSVEDSELFNHGLGVAPFAKVGDSKIFTCAGSAAAGWTPPALAADAYAASARIANNSWGAGTVQAWGRYTTRAQQYDAVVRDARPGDPGNQEMVEVFAAGNDGDATPGSSNEGYGTILAEGTAKNVITVGAAEGVRASGTDGCGTTNADANSARDIVNFSSRGPTDDGRLKPDLVAPSTHVTGARPQYSGFTGYRACTNPFGGVLYTLFSGSSQAAPHVSGAAALIRHWYDRTQGVAPSPALTKALLVNTASDLAGGDNGKGATIAAGPNTDQGWGRVNVGAALDSTAREFRDQRLEDVLNTSGNSVVRSYGVEDTGAPVKITLAWTDAPGPTTGNSYVNDLDLVVDAGGRAYKGNVFGGALSRPGGSADKRNNVESVYLPAGTSGPFAVRVVGSNIPGDGVPGNADATDQDFALVVSNASAQPSPVLTHEATTLDDSPAAGGDGDGALEPTESFELVERVRNAGDAGATGVSGTLTGGAALDITQDDSGWPNLAVGAGADNQTSFEGTLDGSAACGADVPATLMLTFAGGSQSVPLTLPTGAEGTTVSRDQTHPYPGLSITDDNAAGVTSQISVPNPGRIKDVNVRLGAPGNVGIVHEYVGDVVIELTSPDGTTVTLADHPGGPDNNGRDFEGTIFDDEAPRPLGAFGTSDPYTGRFRPQNDQLSRFNGEHQQGVWILRVRDLFEGDLGWVRTWGLDITPAACAVDADPPQTTIDSGPSEGSTVASTSATFGFGSNPGGASFECRLDGEAFAPCSSGMSYSGLADGTHTFKVRARNMAGADPTPATRVWTVDTTPPDTKITSGPASLSRVNATTASVQFVSPDTPGATFECRLDGAAWSSCTEPHTVSGLNDGSHTLEVRAWDAVGNVDGSPASRTWIVDTVAPIPTVSAPSGSTVDSEPTLSGTGGTASGDGGTVTVRVYSGDGHSSPPAATPSHTVTAPVAPGTGRWSVDLPLPPLGLGKHTVQVEQSDGAGNSGRSALAVFSVVTDSVAPIVALTAPANGSKTGDVTPTIAGVAGTAEGDDGTVVVKLWASTLAAGLPSQTMVAPRDPVTGAFAAVPAALANGVYTVRAEQGDAGLPTENIGVSNQSVFTVSVPMPPPPPPSPPPSSPPAPSFVVAPREEPLADALGNRYTVLAACAAACRVNANLSVSSRAARRLGLRARSVSLGRSARSLGKAGTAALKVRLTRTARSALRASSGTKATLTVKVFDGGQTLTLRRSVSLQRSVGIARIARRGLGLWAVCSRTCPLRGSLTVSARDARRLAMRPGAAKRVTIAAGRANASPAATGLRLKVKRMLRKALRRRARLATRLELTAGSGFAGERRALRSFTLRR
jgi:subtilisin-like proprotein convertase family protein